MPKPKSTTLDKLGLSKVKLGQSAATNNTKWTDNEIKKSDLLVLRNAKTEFVANVIAPNGFQVGLTQNGYSKNLLVTGDVTATGLTGSLTQLKSGAPYLKSGTNIAITTGSDGSVTISSDNIGTAIDIAGLSNSLTYSTLASGDLAAIADVNDSNNVKKITVANIGRYLGSATNAGLIGGTSSGKLYLDFDNLASATVNVGSDLIAFYDSSSTDTIKTKKDTIADLVEAIRGTTSDTGLTSTSGVLSIDITNMSTVASLAGSDEILIYDITESGLKKTTVSDIQNLGLDLDTVSAGIIDVGNDSIVFIDSSDSNGSKKESVVDFIAAIAGTGLSAAAGVLSLTSNAITVTAGDGLTGGGSVALGSSTTLTVDASGFAGTGLEDDGSGNLRISSAAAGAGLTGGSGTALSLSFGNGSGNVAQGSNTITIVPGDGLSTGGTAIIGNATSNIVLDIEPEDFAGTGISVSNNNMHTYLSASTNITITTGSDGHLIIAADGAGLGSMSSFNIQSDDSNTSTIENSETIILSGGIGVNTYKPSDNQIVFDIDDSVVATLSGSQFSGNVGVTGSIEATSFFSGSMFKAPVLSGSLTQLEDGSSYLIAGNNITITTGSNGSITIAAATGSAGSNPGSPVNSVQFNNSGTLGGDTDFLYNSTDNILTLSGTVQQLTASIFSTEYSGSVSLITQADFDSNITFVLPEDVGEKFQFLQTDGTGNLTFDFADRVRIQVRNNSGYDLDAGTPVYITGYNAGGDRAYIAVSSASLDSTMPAAAILAEDLNNNSNGHAALIGFLEGVDTSAFSVGNTLYVAADGGLTDTKPLDADVLIQNVGFVLKAANNGIMYVTSPGRTNDVPNDLVGRAGLSGSLQTLVNGDPYLIAGTNITISTGSDGSITISSTGSGGGGSITASSGSTTITNMSTIRFGPGLIMNEDSTGIASVTASIGLPEDGTYTDGLFTDFTPSTPIGTAIDRFNEILSSLSPSPAPALDNISENVSNGISAVLSFGASNDQTSETPSYPSVLSTAGLGDEKDVNETYSATTDGDNNIRLGIYAKTQDVSGILNDDVVSNNQGGGSYVNYPANSFGDGDTGVLKLEVNGSVLKEIDLTVEAGAGDSGSGTADYLNANLSGFLNISTATAGTFSNGSTFETFKHRTGEYIVKTADQRNGWNYLRVTHVKTGSTVTTNYVEWVNDDNADALNSAGNSINFEGSGSIHLSGVEYFQSGSLTYNNRVSNAYKYVYDTNNVTFSTSNSADSSNSLSFSFSALSKESIDTAGGEDHTKQLHITRSTDIDANYFLNGTVTVGTNVTHPLKANLSNSGQATANQILMYNLTNTSSPQLETFRREDYRIISSSYDTQASTTASENIWNSETYITGSGAHSDGLQFYDRKLFAPTNTLNSGDFSSFANGPSGNPDYSAETSGKRTFFRTFQNNSGDFARDFDITISGTGTDIDSLGTSLSTDNIHVLIRCPQTSSWMDLGSEFNYQSSSYGDGGYIGTFTRALGTQNHFSFGTGSIAANDRIVVAIEADASWAGNISEISVNFPATANNAVNDSDPVQDLDSADSGNVGYLSFGASNDLSSVADGSYVSVTNAAGLGSEDVNDLYTTETSSGNERIRLFQKTTEINGTVNQSTNANGNSYPANSFRDGHTGSLVLEINGVESHSVDLYNFTLGTVGNTTSYNSNGSGFFNITEALNGKDGDNLPDFRKFYRTADYKVSTADQVNGMNYVRVIHRIDGETDRETDYIEWVNDDDSNNISISNTGYTQFGAAAFYNLSGVKYFTTTNRPTGSFDFTVSNAYRNVYSDSSSAISTSTSLFTVTSIEVSGSKLTSGGNTVSGTSRSLQTLDATKSDVHEAVFDVTASIRYSGANSLPPSSVGVSTTQRRGSFNSTISHVFSAKNASVGSTNSDYFLVFSDSNTSNANTREYFDSETYRLVSGSYAAQSDVTDSSNEWSSTTSLNDNASYPEHATGLLIYNTQLMSPTKGPDSGDFRDVNEGGSFIAPPGNPDYSSLTNSERDYYRYFYNNTVNSVAQVTITVYGDATLVTRATALSGKNVYIDAKIPGKTGFLDTALGALGGNNDGDGGLSGDLDPTIDGSGATNICTFNGQRLLGSIEGSEYLILRIVTNDSWTGYISRIDVSYS